MASASGSRVENRLAQSVARAQPDKDGRIVIANFLVADPRDRMQPPPRIAKGTTEKATMDGSTLTTIPLAYDANAVMAEPSLRDEVKVVLPPDLVTHLNELGIGDPVAHFKGRTLQVRGVREAHLYTGFPAFFVYTITVSRLDDIKVASAVRP